MKNKKGFLVLGLAALPFTFAVMAMSIGAACIWHIPAWTKAKKEHKEAQYQSQKMFPQGKFGK